MDLLNPLLKPVRTLWADASPVGDLERIEQHLLATGEAIRGATESIESHVEALDKLADALGQTLPALNETLTTTLPALVAAVEKLSSKVEVVAEALAPVVRAEEDLGRVGHLFGRHRDAGAANPAVPPPES